LSRAKTVLTVHNLAYQGLFPSSYFPALGLDSGFFNAGQFEFYGMINFLKSGLASADRLTAVSPTYACEIQRNGCGFGLEGVLRERSGDLSGILNGVDYGVWNPETDTYIKRRYSTNDLAGKLDCKLALQESYGLDRDADVPLLCMVTRLADGKGLELVMETIECLLADGAQFVMLGRGDRCFEEYFLDLASRWPGKAGVKIAFDEALAHQTIAGADMLLMPSRHEPCGLTQMYALKYGTIPIVRRTGGLADTVEPYNANTATGDGFVFDDYNGAALLESVRQALAVFERKAEWQSLMRRGMSADHSWSRSMQAYLRLYRELVPDRQQLG
jgi:starch synthase